MQPTLLSQRCSTTFTLHYKSFTVFDEEIPTTMCSSPSLSLAFWVSRITSPGRMRLSQCLVKEPDDLSCNMLSPCLFMVHDTRRCGEHNVAKLTRWKKLHNPFLEIVDAHVVPGRNDTGFVQAASHKPKSAKPRCAVLRLSNKLYAYRPLS